MHNSIKRSGNHRRDFLRPRISPSLPPTPLFIHEQELRAIVESTLRAWFRLTRGWGGGGRFELFLICAAAGIGRRGGPVLGSSLSRVAGVLGGRVWVSRYRPQPNSVPFITQFALLIVRVLVVHQRFGFSWVFLGLFSIPFLFRLYGGRKTLFFSFHRFESLEMVSLDSGRD